MKRLAAPSAATSLVQVTRAIFVMLNFCIASLRKNLRRELSAEEMQQYEDLQEQEGNLREKMEVLDIDDEEEYEEYKKL
ncbi:hypothetical protein BGZ81_001573, partial [Podila clonocystis]